MSSLMELSPSNNGLVLDPIHQNQYRDEHTNSTNGHFQKHKDTFNVEHPQNVSNEWIQHFLYQMEKDCEIEDSSTDLNSITKGLHCPKIFDGWTCWNETKAGTIAFAPCPPWIPGFVPSNFGHKMCMEDGNWFRREDNNRTWSNYTSCVDIEDLQWRRIVITLYECGYLISVLALIISLIIFCSFKCLECTRVRIHKHLFVSFIVSNLLWMAYYRLVVDSPGILLRNPEWCKLLHLFVHYFMVANYFWMFCEGFYLHTLLVLAFIRSDTTLLRSFYIFGWICPILPIIPYAYFRYDDFDKNQACWVDETQWNYIISIPVCISLVLSLAFLINILRVLVRKLKDNQRNFKNVCRRNSSVGALTDNHLSLRKAVRATLILIPLLGLHYLLIPFRPEQGTSEALVYDVVAAAVASLQGFCVSLLFCFCNNEVLIVFRRKFLRRRQIPKSPTFQPENSCEPTSMSIMAPRKASELYIEDQM